jgi:SNF2 family DNA or RNA helicase
MKWVPHNYQHLALEFTQSHPESGLFLRPGLGKTSISLSLIKRLKRQGQFKGALIIAPLRPAYLVWPAEVEKWDNFQSLSWCILHEKEKDEYFDEGRYDLYFMNPEGLPWLLRKLHNKRATSWPFDTLIIDESTKFKNPSSQRVKLLKKIAPKFKRRHLLTGTPAPKGLMDLFGQFLIMDGGKTFGTKIGSFRKKYFYKSGYMGHDWKMFPRSQEQIHRAIAPSIIQMRAEDYLELPQLVINKVLIELPPDAREAYNKIEKDFRVDFTEGRVTAMNAGVVSSKCRQIASGGVYLDGQEQTWKHVHLEKAKACADILEELQGNPALVAYEWRHDLDRLERSFGQGIPTIRGRMSMARTRAIEQQWNRGESSLLFGQHTAIALGLNLQGAGNTIIVHTLPWNFETWDQLICRIYRQGQKSKQVFVHALVARKTIDEAVWTSLQERNGVHISLFDALKEYWG